MITPEMNFRKNIQLSASDLNEAEKLAETVNEELSCLVREAYDEDSTVQYEQLENGNYQYHISNDSFTGMIELVTGWDMQQKEGENIKFMALNSSGAGGSRYFKDSKKTLEALPDYGYYGGMLSGAILGFAICMLYAIQTEVMDATFYAVFTIIAGWLGSMAGKFIGNRLYDKKYDSVTSRAMENKEFLGSAARWLSLTGEVEKLLDKVKKEDSEAA